MPGSHELFLPPFRSFSLAQTLGVGDPRPDGGSRGPRVAAVRGGARRGRAAHAGRDRREPGNRVLPRTFFF